MGYIWYNATHYYVKRSRISSRLKIAGVNWPLGDFNEPPNIFPRSFQPGHLQEN